MKILFISDHYPPYIKGGAAVSTSLLARWLSQNNNIVSVICSNFVNQPWAENGIMIYPIILRSSFKSKNFLSAVWHALTIIIQQVESTIQVLRLMKKLRPDIVNVVPADYRCVPIIIGIRIFSKCPIVVDCRDYSLICPAHLSATYLGKKKDFNEETQSHHGYRCIGYVSTNDVSFLSIRPFAIYEACMFNLYKSSLRFLINNFDGIKLVGVSKYVQRQLILNGFKAEKITSIYNISRSLDIRPLNIESEIPTFAYGGRIEEDKGIWDIVAAVEILRQQLKQLFAVRIAGTGGEFNKLQKYVRDNNLDCITLLGHIRPDEILALYEQSLAIIGPSHIPEPFGRFILESMSVGKPIIATRTGGITEAVDDRITGLLIDVGSAEQLAAAMKYFIEDPERSTLMKPAIINKQKAYQAGVIGEKRLELYRELTIKTS